MIDLVWLLDRDGRADCLEHGLRLLGSLLVDLLKYPRRRGVHHVLRLLKAKASQGPHFLDDLDLLLASSLEDDVELVLLLDLFGRRTAACGGRAGDGYGSRGLDVKRVFELLH